MHLAIQATPQLPHYFKKLSSFFTQNTPLLNPMLEDDHLFLIAVSVTLTPVPMYLQKQSQAFKG